MSKMVKAEKIRVDNYEVETDLNPNIGGSCLTFKCPQCGNEIMIAPIMWWKNVCSCGRKWNFYCFVESDEIDEEYFD